MHNVADERLMAAGLRAAGLRVAGLRAAGLMVAATRGFHRPPSYRNRVAVF